MRRVCAVMVHEINGRCAFRPHITRCRECSLPRQSEQVLRAGANEAQLFQHIAGSRVVVEMAGRFPGARNVDEFWRRLCDGDELVSFFSDEELTDRGVDRSTTDDLRAGT